jgi:hypothetical protein
MNMPYIDTEHLFKCETCRFYRNGKCNTFCDAGESYSPNLAKIPTADVVPRDEYDALRINLKAMRYELRSLKTRYEELHYKYQIAASDGYNKLIVELKEKHTKGGEGE